MAALRDRSMNAEMLEGQCDGTYKRVVAERSNIKSDDTRLLAEVRLQLNRGVNGYGIFEAPVKRTGDGRFCR
jgi:hypothetical protein